MVRRVDPTAKTILKKNTSISLAECVCSHALPPLLEITGFNTMFFSKPLNPIVNPGHHVLLLRLAAVQLTPSHNDHSLLYDGQHLRFIILAKSTMYRISIGLL